MGTAKVAERENRFVRMSFSFFFMACYAPCPKVSLTTLLQLASMHTQPAPSCPSTSTVVIETSQSTNDPVLEKSPLG